MSSSSDYVLRLSDGVGEWQLGLPSTGVRVLNDHTRYYAHAAPIPENWETLPIKDVAAFFAAFVYGFARTHTSPGVATGIHIEKRRP
jgi:hypothetical protein